MFTIVTVKVCVYHGLSEGGLQQASSEGSRQSSVEAVGAHGHIEHPVRATDDWRHGRAQHSTLHTLVVLIQRIKLALGPHTNTHLDYHTCNYEDIHLF